MRNVLQRYIPTCLLILFAAATVSAQTVSRVYITTSSGINVYNVTATGKLTAVAGSPFKGIAGLAIGTAGNHFIAVGTTYIHSYAVTATGGTGACDQSCRTLAFLISELKSCSSASPLASTASPICTGLAV